MKDEVRFYFLIGTVIAFPPGNVVDSNNKE